MGVDWTTTYDGAAVTAMWTTKIPVLHLLVEATTHQPFEIQDEIFFPHIRRGESGR
jgi:hypothetical protein